MFIVGFLKWWYGAGWRARLTRVGERIVRVFDYFSLDLLMKTWLSPFRQIGTGQTGKSLGDQFRSMIDALISRAIGGVVRTIMIIVGAVVVAAVITLGILEGILWLFVPLFPVVGVVMFAVGWVPSL